MDIVTGLVGVLSAVIVQGFKKLPQVPIGPGQTARLRGAAVGLVFLGNLLHAWLSQDVGALEVLGNTFVGYLVSYLTYKGIIADPHKPPATPVENSEDAGQPA